MPEFDQVADLYDETRGGERRDDEFAELLACTSRRQGTRWWKKRPGPPSRRDARFRPGEMPRRGIVDVIVLWRDAG